MFFLILSVSNHVLTVEHCRNDSLNLRKDGECSAQGHAAVTAGAEKRIMWIEES